MFTAKDIKVSLEYVVFQYLLKPNSCTLGAVFANFNFIPPF